MPIHERDRIRFHGWLVAHDLDREVADAILATMPPYDWHELATKSDLAVLERRMDRTDESIRDLRTEVLESRRELGSEFADLRSSTGSDLGDLRREIVTELHGLRHEIRIVLLALVGFMASVLLSVALVGLI